MRFVLRAFLLHWQSGGYTLHAPGTRATSARRAARCLCPPCRLLSGRDQCLAPVPGRQWTHPAGLSHRSGTPGRLSSGLVTGDPCADDSSLHPESDAWRQQWVGADSARHHLSPASLTRWPDLLVNQKVATSTHFAGALQGDHTSHSISQCACVTALSALHVVGV